jgi:LysM repeat protein
MATAYFGTLIYTVLPGNTLSTIAHNYNTTIENILKFNRLPNPNRILPGQKIILPLSPPESIIYTVKPGDTLYHIALKYKTLVANLIKYNYLIPSYYIHPGQKLVVTASLRNYNEF